MNEEFQEMKINIVNSYEILIQKLLKKEYLARKKSNQIKKKVLQSIVLS